MIEIIIQFVAHTVFIGFRTANMRHIVNDKKLMALLSNKGIQVAHLSSMSLAILNFGEILDGDVSNWQNWGVIAAYILGGDLGTYLGMRLKK